MQRLAAAALALVAGGTALAACGGGSDGASDGGADAAADAIVGTTCVQYGGESYLRMAIAGAHDGYFNWESEGVECAGSFDDHSLSWEIPGLHAVTLVIPDMVAYYMADGNSGQMKLLLSAEGSFDTGPDGCVINLIQNYEHDPENYPGIYRVRGSGECAEPARPEPPEEQVVNIMGSFAFAGYVLVSE